MQHTSPRTALPLAPFSLILPLFIFAFIIPLQSHAATIVTTQTVANLAAVNDQTAVTTTTTANTTAGTNDQTVAVATTTANVAQTSATRTLTVGTVPTNAQTTTIGSCVITYSTGSADSLNCTSNAATLNVTTHNTPASLAAAIATLTHVSDVGHGLLAISTTTTTNDIFTTVGVEASATAVSFTDGTSGAITSTASTAGVIPAVELLTLTPAGTIDTGDTYTIYSPGILTATYTVQSTDSTLANIANGLVTTIKGLAGYGSLPFTAATSTNTILLTAKTAGTGFGLATSTTNRAAVAQVNATAIGGTVEAGDKFSITIPGSGTVTYTAQSSDTTLANLATGLNAALQATTTYSSFPFTSAVSGNTVVLTAKTAGTGFTNTSGTTNTAPIAEVVTFVVPSFSSFANAGISLNANQYSATAATSLASLVATLFSGMSGDPAVTCTLSNSTFTCTAKTPGVAYSYGATFGEYSPSTDGVSGNSSGGGSSYHAPITTSASSNTKSTGTTSTVSPAVPMTPVLPVTTVSGASKIKVTLKYQSHNSSVKILQQILSSDPSLNYSGGVTGYYGHATQAAVGTFQTNHGVVQPGQAGYGNVSTKTKAMLVQVYGA
jgi:hypothetical protein